MSEFIKIAREPHPSCKLPENLDTAVWRYMDVDKFNSLLNEKALYLCRADLMQDRFEGSYSRHQIFAMKDWFTEIRVPQMIEIERERRRKDRLKTYISCWCMSDCELDLMWKGYVRNPPGIAIKSSVRRLINICDKAVGNWPLDISMVAYYDHVEGERNYFDFGTPAIFLNKDNHFKLDNELRIIHYPNIIGQSPNFILLKIDLKNLIENVVLQPGAKENILKYARQALSNVGLDKIPVLTSRDDRELIE